MSVNNKVTLSIVSHGQGNLIANLLKDLDSLDYARFDVIVTINIPEDEYFCHGHGYKVEVIRNDKPKGFGENHNQAFKYSSNHWFAVVNPDIRLSNLDVDRFLSPFSDESVAAVAPIVISAEGNVEDSARRFPTLTRLAMRVFLGRRDSDYQVETEPYAVDWVAGMFVVFRQSAYQAIGGFDHLRYFMYMEDADICCRLSKRGWKVIVNPATQVIHLAQRASRKNFKHLKWHIVSAFRFLTGL